MRRRAPVGEPLARSHSSVRTNQESSSGPVISAPTAHHDADHAEEPAGERQPVAPVERPRAGAVHVQRCRHRVVRVPLGHRRRQTVRHGAVEDHARAVASGPRRRRTRPTACPSRSSSRRRRRRTRGGPGPSPAPAGAGRGPSAPASAPIRRARRRRGRPAGRRRRTARARRSSARVPSRKRIQPSTTARSARLVAADADVDAREQRELDALVELGPVDALLRRRDVRRGRA